MAIEGSSIYEPEVMELLKRLEARGILLIVLDGKKAARPITYASALTFPDIVRAISALEIVAKEMRNDLMRIVAGQSTTGMKAKLRDED